MTSIPSASGELFSSFIVWLHSMQLMRSINGLLSSLAAGLISRSPSPARASGFLLGVEQSPEIASAVLQSSWRCGLPQPAYEAARHLQASTAGVSLPLRLQPRTFDRFKVAGADLLLVASSLESQHPLIG